MQTDSGGALVSAAFGPVPVDLCPGQIARDGEDYAVCMASQLVMAPLCCTATAAVRLGA